MSEPVRSLEAVRNIYDAWGRHPSAYAAQDWMTFLGRHREIRRLAARSTRAGPGARVLEVACGTGRNLPYLEQIVGLEGSLVAFDHSEGMLTAARALVRRFGWQNVRFVQGDAAELEVGNARFDAVLCVLGMSAIPDHLRALKRCRDVLAPRGVLSVCDARPFPGRLRVLNPLLRAIYVPTTGWDPDRDVAEDMRRVFGNVSVTPLNFGSFFVATSVRTEA